MTSKVLKREKNETIDDYMVRRAQGSIPKGSRISDPKKEAKRRELEATMQPSPITGDPMHSAMGWKRAKISPELSVPAAARYGIPTIYGLASLFTGGGSLVGGASVMAASETLARELEKKVQGPEYASLAQFMMDKGESIAGGVAVGALDLLFGVAGTKMLPALRKRTFLPKESTYETEAALRLLKETPRKKMLGVRDRPSYTPTLGQLNNEEGRWISWAEQLLRSSFGGERIFGRVDRENVKVLTERIFGSYLDEVQRTSSPHVFAEFLEEMIGKIHNVDTKPGIAFDPMKAYGKYLYKLSDRELANVPAFDATNVVDYIANHANKGIMDDAWSMVHVDDATGKKLLPDITNLQSWQKISALNADAALKYINKKLKTTSDSTIREMLKGIHNKLSSSFEKAMTPDAKVAYKAAKKYWGNTEELLRDEVLKSISRKLATSPDAVAKMIGSTDARYKRLQTLKAVINESWDATDKMYKLEGDFNAYWDRRFLQPLRKEFIDKVVDKNNQLLPKIFESTVKKYSDLGPEYLNTLFPKSGGAEKLQEFAAALSVLTSKLKGDSIAIQLIQGGQIVRVAQATAAVGGGAAYGYKTGDVKKGLMTGTLVLFVTPIAFSHILSNRSFLNLAINGMHSGPRTREMTRFIRRVGELRVTEDIEYKKMLPEELDFYTTNSNSQPEGGTK